MFQCVDIVLLTTKFFDEAVYYSNIIIIAILM